MINFYYYLNKLISVIGTYNTQTNNGPNSSLCR